jgi:NTP pyrophosphatase (non-canonical NTP hydrolase)
MSDIKELTQKIVEFRDERNWKQFHNPKDIALSLVLEATEVLEHFQWKNGSDIQAHIEESKGEVAEEIADVLYWVLLMAADLNIDIKEALLSKIDKNAKKYPVEKAYGSAKKYTELQ